MASSNPKFKQSSEPALLDRSWFLKDSAWDDPVWVLRPTNALEETKPIRVDWNFSLLSGLRFTDEAFASLLRASRQLIAYIRSHSLSTGLAQHAGTTAGYFLHLRELVRWMEQAGIRRFSDLDGEALLQFQHALAGRPGIGRATLSPATLQKYVYLLIYLYRARGDIDDALQVDPCPGRGRPEAGNGHEDGLRHWPHTPDAIAVALVQGATDMVTNGATSILQARQVYAEAMDAACRRGCGNDARTNAANRALLQAGIAVPLRSQSIRTVDELCLMIDMLYAACFVVISYLVGPRVSEIVHLEAGCVQVPDAHGDDEGGDALRVIVGAIFKRQAEYHGRPHEWVAPPPAVLAISVLEALSAGHRAQTGKAQLWLRRRGIAGATEWQNVCPGLLAIASAHRLWPLLQRFARWLDVPMHQGKRWQLSTHQGRKTFARFAALRDRTGLFALAQHLGHRERAVTDHGYAGSDYRLNEEIKTEILEQSVAAWEHMLAAPGLGGRAGAEIMVKRPRFRGARIKQDIKGYARLLVDAGLVLGICEWGFCVYREEHSACLGNAVGPNPARREPSTCSRCKNFSVSAQHRPYWADQVNRQEALLNEPALPLQTLRIVRDRLNEARALVRAIDGDVKEGRK